LGYRETKESGLTKTKKKRQEKIMAFGGRVVNRGKRGEGQQWKGNEKKPKGLPSERWTKPPPSWKEERGKKLRNCWGTGRNRKDKGNKQRFNRLPFWNKKKL